MTIKFVARLFPPIDMYRRTGDITKFNIKMLLFILSVKLNSVNYFIGGYVDNVV